VPYANNQGVRIHYEVEGDGPPLMLLHGLTGSLEAWHDGGYIEHLKKHYRLILMDARGHGASDKPHDPEAYTMKLLATDVVAVLDDLNIGKAHFFGYSMGAWIGFGIAKYAPHRFHSLILGGAHPYADPDSTEQALQFLKQGKNEMLAQAEKILGPRMTPELKAQVEARFAANDDEALIALVSSSDWPKDFGDVLPTMTMQVLLFAGETDPFYPGAKQCAKSIPNATFVSFPRLGHMETRFRSDLVLPHITKFLEKATQT